MCQTMAISLSPLLPLLNLHPGTRPFFLSSLKLHHSTAISAAHFRGYTLSLPTEHNRWRSWRGRRGLRLSALPDGDVPAESAIQEAQQVISGNNDVGSSIVAFLLGAAFIGLTILTIGVIYIGVTDFLQKREKEKFEKEEATKKKKGGKKRVVRAKTGPRGFGQKLEEEGDDDI
ncbi:uncharacterized protein LOC116256858 [Nymphaea colorata]|nr:uncharacterized protein LOC116256858 [Nymphaea colorata]